MKRLYSKIWNLCSNWQVVFIKLRVLLIKKDIFHFYEILRKRAIHILCNPKKSSFNVCLMKILKITVTKTRSPGTTSVCFSVVTVNDEHRKPELKTKRRVNCKECSGLKATGIFVILLSQDGLERSSSERKSSSITS